MKQLPEPQPIFHCRLVRLKDADTLVARLDRWFADESVKTVRLLEVDTPELRGGTPETRAAAQAARDFALAWFAEASLSLPDAWPGAYPLVLQSGPIDSFGRVLGTIWRKSDEACLNVDLVTNGHGTYVSPLVHMRQLGAR